MQYPLAMLENIQASRGNTVWIIQEQQPLRLSFFFSHIFTNSFCNIDNCYLGICLMPGANHDMFLLFIVLVIFYGSFR